MRDKIRMLMILCSVQLKTSRVTDEKRFNDINDEIEEVKGMILSELDQDIPSKEETLNINSPYQI